MAEIKPLKGIFYRKELWPSLKELTTPPYDVISSAEQENFYKLHPLNIIRLELPKENEAEHKTRYEVAAETFFGWLRNGVLQQEKEEGYYVYEQSFFDEGRKITRTSFLAGLKLVPYKEKEVLPHENTIPKHKEDRYQLLKACHANISPIFGLYADEEEIIDELLNDYTANNLPLFSFTDEEEIEHKLWKITEEETLEIITETILPLTVFIADGHHRYETALKLAEEMKKEKKEGFDHILIALVNLYHQGLVIYPTHRLLKNIPSYDHKIFLQKLEQYFILEELEETGATEIKTILNEAKEKYQNAFVLYDGNLTLLKLKPKIDPAEILAPQHSPAWRKLDVSVLSEMILKPSLGIDEEKEIDNNRIAYTHNIEEAIETVKNKNYQLAFILNPSTMEEITEVALAGDKMPRKSTYFYPKLRTGLVINPLGHLT